MIGRTPTIFFTPYFQFEKRFDFIFVYVIFCVRLPGIMENSVKCHGKVMEFYYQISYI